MNQQGEGPILESRHHEGLQPERKNPIVFIVAGIFLVMGLGAFLFVEKSDKQEQQLIEEIEAQIVDETQDIAKEEAPLIKPPAEKEEGTVDFFYQRALQKDQAKDYEGAVEDYTKTIELANKYSLEMWESLNNRGVIRAEQFNDLKGALKDFNKIIDIEINRYDGEIDAVKLESAYSNRAYIKMAQGNNEGACDDLYEALSYADENSMAFLEKNIAKNCE